ncbi:MAG: TIGR00269 family protein [Candidatus Micrarchaeota archaeon]|nr:TIGR00269 family protein [Candidatus Micrarchaeota archaeon]
MKCSECNADAIIYLAYSQKFLCGKHFSRLTEKRAGAAMREHAMVRGKKRIGVAISGGKDSLALLYIMHKLLGKDRRLKLIALTVDEGIGEYRSESIKRCNELCSQLGVEHHIYSFKDYAVPMRTLMRRRRTDPCSYCGVFRRWILNKAARELKLDALAVAHNLDDTVQTFLMNLMRNEPLRMLRFRPCGGISDSEEFVPRIRPLFAIPEREVLAYALHNGIKFHVGKCPYAHYAIRNHVRKFVADMEERYPGTKFALLNSYLYMLRSLRLDEVPDITKCRECGEPSTSGVCKRCILLSDALRK